ncbi:MAG: DUF4231 domain-containing protein [Calditrichia bacterium]
MSTSQIPIQHILFKNGHSAHSVLHNDSTSIKNIVRSLKLPDFEGVIVIVGGTQESEDAEKNSRIEQLFNRGILQAALNTNALLIDGGTDYGVMKKLGQAVADRSERPVILGIAPRGKINLPGENVEGNHSLEPNHSHFVFADSAKWDDSTSLMFRLAEQLSNDKPVMAVLVNGGKTSKDCIVQATRRGWRTLVLKGSERLADQIAATNEFFAALKQDEKAVEGEETTTNKPSGNLYWTDDKKPVIAAGGNAAGQTLLVSNDGFIADPQLAEIVIDGNLDVIDLNEGLEPTIEKLSSKVTENLLSDNFLESAWQRFTLYDHNANLHRDRFRKVENWVLFLSVLSTLLAVFKVVLENQLLLHQLRDLERPSWLFSSFPGFVDLAGDINSLYLHWSIVLVPIVLTALLAGANRFKFGKKWINLRANAESIKSEIFRYRCLSGPYGWKPEEGISRQSQLAHQLKVITRQTMLTEVNQAALLPYSDVGDLLAKDILAQDTGENNDRLFWKHSSDDLFSLLTPQQYIDWRVKEQKGFFVSKSNKLAVKLGRLQWSIFILAGFGTLLAAFGFEIWIAVTTAIAVAIGTKLQFDQVEETLMIYNQASTDLENVIEWWEALSPLQRKQRRFFNKMVETTEQVLEGETKGWSQNMTDALAKLRDTQREDGFMGSLEAAVENYKDDRARGNLIHQMANLIKTIPDHEKKAQLAEAMKEVLNAAVEDPVPDPLEE